jgi:hypothetical protein
VPTESASVEPTRTCWDGSQVTGSERCKVPTADKGLEAVSPSFVAARRGGLCESSPDDHTAGGYNCRVDGALLHYAWFDSLEDQDEHFAGIYPSCKPRGDLQLCTGPKRAALRYADQRLLFEVTVPKSQIGALEKVRFLPSEELLEGKDVS